MRFESYAQFFEDLILFCALKDVGKGFYIDVGANDPTDLSVTKFFYDRGWHGINIEPLTSACAVLEEMRPRDINLCVGLGSKPGKLELFEGGVSSTFLEDVAIDNNISAENRRQKNVLTLSDVYERYCAPNQEVHFCKIDVEGYERQVLEGVTDWHKFRPWIFAMESALPGTSIPCHEKWESLLLEHDYFCAFSFEINRFYLAAEKEHLLANFAAVNDFVFKNEIVKLNVAKVVFSR